jgi:hypothetical protein
VKAGGGTRDQPEEVVAEVVEVDVLAS